MATSLPVPFAVAVLDSALKRGHLRGREWALFAAQAPRAAREVISRVDGRSESGTESVLRVLLQDAGIPATPQPPLPLGYGERADLLVGDRLLIECDSEEHHAKPESRKADLRRDAWLTSLGFVVLRFDYSQVFTDPLGVVETVASVVERGDHLSLRPGELAR
ncbi:endonuclease domain-containing protein [Microcella alkaliphila]|uniref:endonuclease domain-containing protein n=1 Tax=Microcella alkaliphila TaxID=279828 RepID=UPI00130075CB|nr:DUF559 domain-containing protein [Microcella alkaliphila]